MWLHSLSLSLTLQQQQRNGGKNVEGKNAKDGGEKIREELDDHELSVLMLLMMMFK